MTNQATTQKVISFIQQWNVVPETLTMKDADSVIKELFNLEQTSSAGMPSFLPFHKSVPGQHKVCLVEFEQMYPTIAKNVLDKSWSNIYVALIESIQHFKETNDQLNARKTKQVLNALFGLMYWKYDQPSAKRITETAKAVMQRMDDSTCVFADTDRIAFTLSVDETIEKVNSSLKQIGFNIPFTVTEVSVETTDSPKKAVWSK
jgi:hypothetical protein